MIYLSKLLRTSNFILFCFCLIWFFPYMMFIHIICTLYTHLYIYTNTYAYIYISIKAIPPHSMPASNSHTLFYLHYINFLLFILRTLVRLIFLLYAACVCAVKWTIVERWLTSEWYLYVKIIQMMNETNYCINSKN